MIASFAYIFALQVKIGLQRPLQDTHRLFTIRNRQKHIRGDLLRICSATDDNTAYDWRVTRISLECEMTRSISLYLCYTPDNLFGFVNFALSSKNQQVQKGEIPHLWGTLDVEHFHLVM